ncbi:putative EA22-like protein [Escherichia albertii]|nr:ead/Ea22-like family protein [Escherichia albertii]CTW42431.1 putative EA22-like protein [Escherichia coli]
MSKIDYQTLRERYSPKPVPECSVCGEEMSIQRISGAHVVYACSSYGGDGDFKIGRTLADEHYEKSRVTVVDDSDPDVIALLDELEAAKSKLNEQREYYEGVISDGSKRIAELEKSEEQLINERDHAESALDDMYFAATGNRPEWSNWFGFSDAVDAVVDRIADLEAKQCIEEMSKQSCEARERDLFESWVMHSICISKSTLEGLRTETGYRNATLSGTDFNRMWKQWKSIRAAGIRIKGE